MRSYSTCALEFEPVNGLSDDDEVHAVRREGSDPLGAVDAALPQVGGWLTLAGGAYRRVRFHGGHSGAGLEAAVGLQGRDEVGG